MEDEALAPKESSVLKILVGPRNLPTDVVVTPSSTFNDVIDSLKENGTAKGAVVIEQWNGCERPVGEDEHPLELLQQWGSSQHEVKYILKSPTSYSKKAVSPSRSVLSPRKSPYRCSGERFSQVPPGRGPCPLSPHRSYHCSSLRFSESPRNAAAMSPKSEVHRLCLRLNECHEQNNRSVVEVQKLREMCAEHERQILQYQQSMQEMRDRLARCRQLSVRQKALKAQSPAGGRRLSISELKTKRTKLQEELQVCQQEQCTLSNEIHSQSALFRQETDKLTEVQMSIQQAEQLLAAEENKPMSTGDSFVKAGDALQQVEGILSLQDGSFVSTMQCMENSEMAVISDKPNETSVHTITSNDDSHFDDVMQIESVSFSRRNSYRRLSGEFSRSKNRWSFGSRMSPSLGAISSVLEEDGQPKSVGRSHSDTAIAQLQQDQTRQKVQPAPLSVALPDKEHFLTVTQTVPVIVSSPVCSPSVAQPSIVPLSPSSSGSPSIVPTTLASSLSPDRTPSPTIAASPSATMVTVEEHETTLVLEDEKLREHSQASGGQAVAMTLSEGCPGHIRFEPLIVLLDSALEGDLEEVEKSAKKVAHLNCSADDGVTALHNAVCGGSNDVVRYLVEHGADVNVVDENGWTPLHCAGSCANDEAVHILVGHGAAILRENDDGQTAHGVAVASLENDDEEGVDTDLENPCVAILQDIENCLGSSDGGLTYAAFSYSSDADDELQFSAGERLCILCKGDESESQWWWAEDQHGRMGYVPCNYLALHPRAAVRV